MKKLLSVVLALLMLAVMLPVTAMAEETLPTAPTMNGNEWTVTTENIQATLDGAYGSIDGKTIILSAGTPTASWSWAVPPSIRAAIQRHISLQVLLLPSAQLIR